MTDEKRKFIIRENPLGDKTTRLIDILDELDMQPIEKAGLRAKIQYEKKRWMDVYYNRDLFVAALDYAKQDRMNIFSVHVFGIDVGMANHLSELLANYLGLELKVERYEYESHYPNSTMIVVVHQDAFEEKDGWEYYLSEEYDKLSDTARHAMMTVEFLGMYTNLAVCVYYDRFYNIHGYVAIKVA